MAKVAQMVLSPFLLFSVATQLANFYEFQGIHTESLHSKDEDEGSCFEWATAKFHVFSEV